MQEKEWQQESYYDFYVGPQENTFVIEDMPTYGNTRLIGNTYSTSYALDLVNVVPKNSVILDLSLTNNVVSGQYCNYIDKEFSTISKAYRNSSKTGDERINFPLSGNVRLDQIWYIRGKCACKSASHTLTWSPHINGTFKCQMQPYPGNEIK